jgi:hypothetical protein
MVAGICAYCGEKPVTVDHVPPKLMLEEPYPPNLVTVPACESCNKKFMKDDEYARTVIALDFRAAGNAAAQSRLPKIFRSLQYPEAKKFSEYLKRQLKPTDFVDANGNPLGIRAEVDVARIDATGERFGRGIYYHLTGTRVPEEWQVYVFSKPGYDSIDFIVPNFNAIMDKCGDHTQGSIGAGFSLVGGRSVDGCVFGFLLYEYFWWIVAFLDKNARIPRLTSDR